MWYAQAGTVAAAFFIGCTRLADVNGLEAFESLTKLESLTLDFSSSWKRGHTGGAELT